MPFDSELGALIQERLDIGHVLSAASHLTAGEQRQFRQQLWNAIDGHERGHVSTMDTRSRLLELRSRIDADGLRRTRGE